MLNDKILKPAALFLAFLMMLALPAISHGADHNFNNYAGLWTGTGWLQMSSGDRETIRCRATYFVRNGGKTLKQNLRCASASYTVDARNELNSARGKITGTWLERTFEHNGKVTGTASGNRLKLNVIGANINALLTVTVTGRKQSVVLSSKGSNISRMVINLKRS